MKEESFKELLEEHLTLVREKLLQSSTELTKRALVHDQDKIFNKTVYDTYEKYFVELKKIPFATEEYYNYEKKYFSKAHEIHAQNRHHFYSSRNESVQNVNLFDLLEAIIDISESANQYGNKESYKESFRKKGIYDLNIEDVINNTIEYLSEKE